MEDNFFKQEWSEIKFYTSLAHDNPPLSTEEEKSLLDEYFSINITLKRKEELKKILVSRNLRMIIKVCKSHQYMGKGLPLMELIHEGVLGLIYFLDCKYDISKGNKLMTGGIWWIRQFVGRAIENKSRIVKLPLHVQAKINKIRTVYREFSGENIKPSPEEISIRIKDRYNEDISPEDVEKLGRDQYIHTSLDDPTEDGQSSLMDFLTINGSDEIDDQVEKSANKDYVHELLSKLTSDEAKLITWKFGLLDYNDRRTGKEMAKIMNMPESQYKQFESQTMIKLRQIAERERVNL